jgi:non-heme chloroperoxidase
MSQPNGIEFATTPLLSTGVSLHYAGQGDQAGEAIVFLHGYSDSWFSYYPVPEEFLETVVSESLKLPARVWRDYWEGVVLTVDYAARLDGIDVPTLILWGEQDALFPREEQERLAAAIPGATLKMYPETGHAVHWERPEWVVRDLEAFIKNTRPAQ